MTIAMPRENGKPSDEKVERILSAALDEFSQRGFESAREGVIARTAGVSTATLKRYYPQKEELFREVVRSTIVNTLESLEPSAGTGVSESAAARLREFARWFWRTMDEPGQSALLRLSVGELHRFPELGVFHTIEVLGRSARKLEQILLEGTARGELHIADPRTTSRVVLSALVTHAHWFAHPDIYGGITGLDRTRAEEAVIEVLVDALRSRLV
jgi:TetR/AcrR family transcriptional regulator